MAFYSVPSPHDVCRPYFDTADNVAQIVDFRVVCVSQQEVEIH
jgi:hypothetical protein